MYSTINYNILNGEYLDFIRIGAKYNVYSSTCSENLLIEENI